MIFVHFFEKEKDAMKTMEEDLLLIRQLKKNVEKFRCGEFCKEEAFFRKVVNVRRNVLEWAHDIIYILRDKKFKGYEDLDFSFSLTLPKDLGSFELRDFETESFNKIVIMQTKLMSSSGIEIDIEPEQVKIQMELLRDVIVDFSVAIEILKVHYRIEENFDIMKVKI